MAQVTSGIRQFLSLPAYFDAFQKLLGSDTSREKVVSRFIKPKEGMEILDIGCGTAEILKFLPANIHYVGFDASSDYIAHAKQHYGDRGQFFQGLVTRDTLESPGSYDLVLASGLLHHLEDDEVTAFAETARKALRPGGRLITIDAAYIPNQNPIAKFLISRDRGQNIRSPEGYAAFFTRDLGWDVTVHLCHDLLRLPYTHLILESTLAE